MKELLKDSYMQGSDKKKTRKAVIDLFEDIRYYEMLLEENDTIKKSKDITSANTSGGISDPTSSTFKKINDMAKAIDIFYKKLEEVKATFTDEEKTVYQHTIVKREKDDVILASTLLYPSKFYAVKNSMYFKIAIKFRLVNPYIYANTKNVTRVIDQLV